jgi:hypothetical protein
MGLIPGREVLEKRKKSLASVPAIELFNHPTHCLVYTMNIIFILINYNYICIIYQCYNVDSHIVIPE